MLSAMLFTSCLSTKTEYVVPDIVFPSFPTIDCVRNDDGTVTVTAEQIIRLAEYKIRIEETEADYMELKKIYEEGGK